MNDLVKADEQLPAQSTAPILQMIERVAMNPEFDVVKLEKMLDMQERVLSRDAEVAFNQAMSRAQAKMPVIQKNKENTQTNSWYATLDAVNKEAVPVYTAEGFSVSYNTVDSPFGDAYIRVVAYVSHVDGHTREYQYDMPIDDSGIKGTRNKTAVHGRASSISYAQRYLISLIFNISTAKDVDGNAPKQEHTKIQAGLIVAIQKLMKEVDRSEEQCLQYVATFSENQYEDLSELSQAEGTRLLNKLKQAKKAMEETNEDS